MEQIYSDFETLTKASVPVAFLNEFDKVDEEVKAETLDTIAKLKEILTNRTDIIALSAPQIGVHKRIFCIKFADDIKTFINPVIKKRSPEKFVNFEKWIDFKTNFVVLRPTELEVVYFTDELKMEDNKLLGQAAATFIAQYNLLDGIAPGKLVSDILTMSEITLDDLPAIVEAAYSGAGIILDDTDQLPELNEAAEALTNLADGLFTAKLKEIMEAKDEPELQKAARCMWAQEMVILGHTKIVDQEGYEREKKQQRQEKLATKAAKSAQFRAFCGKVSK